MIGIIDADLIERKKHRFPNLASMKISGFYKDRGDDVELLTDWNDVRKFASKYGGASLFLSKVFTDTDVPDDIVNIGDIHIGGTGFYFDKADPLPDYIEHHMPDYHLYDKYISEHPRPKEFKEYEKYSIGFLTRGCFRKCPFCVNQNYDRVVKWSPLEEFYDPSRDKILLCDDNFLGHPDWKKMLQDLQNTGKPFKFKQGLDERLLTEEKVKMIFLESRYDGEVTFAFDNIEDYDLIERKLELIRSITNKGIMFYVLCAFDRNGKYDEDFYRRDFEGVFRRIELLAKYNAQPYIMRFNKYEESPYRGMYINIARWCNQYSYIKKQSLHDYITITDWKNGGRSSSKYLETFKNSFPDLYEKYCYKLYY